MDGGKRPVGSTRALPFFFPEGGPLAQGMPLAAEGGDGMPLLGGSQDGKSLAHENGPGETAQGLGRVMLGEQEDLVARAQIGDTRAMLSESSFTDMNGDGGGFIDAF